MSKNKEKKSKPEKGKEKKEKGESKSVIQKFKTILFNSSSVSEKDEKGKRKKEKGEGKRKKGESKTENVKLITDNRKPITDNGKPTTDKQDLFNVSEIFYSIQGESTFSGLPCVFIRFQGCNIRCSWCDTGYALNVKKEKNRLSEDQIIEKVKKYDCKYVCITGGEPLMQKRVPELMTHLCNNGYTVSIETNGYYSLKDIDKRVAKIVDFKCPGSKMQKKNNFANIEFLTKNDEVKFVIKDKEDYKWMKDIILKNNLSEKVNTVLLSPAFGKLEPKQLSNWILKDNLKVRVQLQVHKYIWNPKKRGV